MSAIDFTDNTTVVPAAWLDDVDASVYEQTGVGKTTVASATTPVIFAVTVGRLIDYTGTVTCTGFVAAVSAGSERTLYCAGAAVFTAGVNLLIDGVVSGTNLTCVAGDILDVVANTTTQFNITKRTNTPKRIARLFSSVDGGVATGTTLIPFDDTIPQNTEGDQFLSLEIAPQNANSTLIIEVLVNCANSVASQVTVALFLSTQANALACSSLHFATVDKMRSISIKHWIIAASTTTTTYTVRVGGDTAGTITFNGVGGARKFGGTLNSFIKITEILP